MTGYFVSNGFAGTEQNVTTTAKTITRLVVPASSGKRFFIFEIDVGQNAAPNATDCQVEWDLNFADATTAGTKTSITPYNAFDTAVTTAFANYSAEPTAYSAATRFWHKSINQRNSALWQAAPGSELFIPSTASEGPGLRALSTNYASTVLGTMRFTEI